MTVNEIFNRAAKSRLLQYPFVEKVWESVQGDSLFRKTPDQLRVLRAQMTRESLLFFKRHSSYYSELHEPLNIEPSSAGIEDLAKLAVPSDMLRGEGHKPFLIPDVEPEGESFQSSGTTGKAPVKLYRSPLDIAIMVKGHGRPSIRLMWLDTLLTYISWEPVS